MSPDQITRLRALRDAAREHWVAIQVLRQEAGRLTGEPVVLGRVGYAADLTGDYLYGVREMDDLIQRL